MTSTSQFNCVICGQGFEQKSRLARHMDTSHPPSAPSAADIERVLSGIQYPKTKEALTEYVSQKRSTVGEDLFDLIKSLPNRTYRDSAEVAIALGELKSGKEFKSAKQAETAEQPSKKGGKAAASESVSAAAIAKVLSGIDFPKTKNSLKQYARSNISNVEVKDSRAILKVIDQLPDKKYDNMAEVEKSIHNIL
ncbi:MAG: DUF2795 domain-containing protein [Candidatus Nitrosopolaris sp.]